MAANSLPTSIVFAPVSTTYAGDRLLTSVRTADGDGPTHTGRPGRLMMQAPLYYRIHVLIALALFALWPFTRLVHAFSVPIAYLFRPYIVYRSRDVAASNQMAGSAPRRRGW